MIDFGGKMTNKEKEEKIFDVIFREKPAMLLVELLGTKSMYASSVSKKIDCTYSHVVKLLKKMEEDKLISFEKKGRLNLLTLTKKGEEVATNIQKIRELL